MGIQKLCEVIREAAPAAIVEKGVLWYRGKTLAIDASVLLYQSLIAIRHGTVNLQNQKGESTAHIQGLLHKSLNLLEKGIIPVFVFDGKPPAMKENVLQKRRETRIKAEKAAALSVTQEDELKHAKRSVKVSEYHVNSAQELLRSLGIPYVSAPGEAEAYCAALNKAGAVDGVVSEDTDVLVFGGKKLLRNFLPATTKKGNVVEIDLDQVLHGLRLDIHEFVDLCILLGCDYCESPKGIGPKKALEAIREHRSIEKCIEEKAIIPPENWAYEQARELFAAHPEVPGAIKTKFELLPHKENEITDFLVVRNGFSQQKVNGAIERLKKQKAATKQKSVLGFFIPKV